MSLRIASAVALASLLVACAPIRRGGPTPDDDDTADDDDTTDDDDAFPDDDDDSFPDDDDITDPDCGNPGSLWWSLTGPSEDFEGSWHRGTLYAEGEALLLVDEAGEELTFQSDLGPELWSMFDGQPGRVFWQTPSFGAWVPDSVLMVETDDPFGPRLAMGQRALPPREQLDAWGFQLATEDICREPVEDLMGCGLVRVLPMNVTRVGEDGTAVSTTVFPDGSAELPEGWLFGLGASYEYVELNCDDVSPIEHSWLLVRQWLAVPG